MTRGGIAAGASLQIAGQSLTEYQARSLAACGARHIIIMVDTLPASLVAAFDRLRGEGFSIDTARTPQEAADRIHPDETALILSPGVVASASLLQSVSNMVSPAILTLPDDEVFGKFERIDREDRWSGIALIQGEALRHTSAQLGDWDFAATTLRIAIQQGATRNRVPENSFLGIVENHADAADASAQLAVTATTTDGSPFGRWIAAPLAAFGLRQAVRSAVPLDIVSVVSPALLLASLLLGWIGWSAASFVTFAVAGIAHGIASGMENCALRASWAVKRFPIMALAGFAILVLFAAMAWSNVGWGIYALSAWVIVNAGLRAETGTAWEPGLFDLALLLAVSALLGFPVGGMIVAVAWQLAPDIVARARALL
jgi:hypothetical protein